MRIFSRCLVIWLSLSTLGMPIAYATEKTPTTPEQVVRGVSTKLVHTIAQRKADFQKSPEHFFAEMSKILPSEVLDYQYMARGTMGRYARQASPEQLGAFQQQFKLSLLEFYGKALLSFNNQNIRVLPTTPDQRTQKTVPVTMEITNPNNVVYKIVYTMVRSDTSWKVRNFIISGINVGKLFRSQFQQAMQTYANKAQRATISKADTQQSTLDFVVAHWVDIIKQGNKKPQQP